MVRTILPLLLAGVLLASGVARAGDDVQGLLDRVLAAYGGAERLQKVKGYRAEGAVQAKIRGATATTTRLFARPGDFRVDVAYVDYTEVRVVLGGKGWRTAQQGIVEVTGPMYDSMALQAARSAIPWILVDNRGKLRPAPAETVDGAALPGFELTLSDSMTLRAWVDPETNLVRKSQSVLASLEMNMEFSTVYADYRPVDGVMFPFREENFAGAAQTGSTILSRFVVDPPEAIEVPASAPMSSPGPLAPGAPNPHGNTNPHAGQGSDPHSANPHSGAAPAIPLPQ